MDMFSSTIIPTIGRPSLSRAVHSILDQAYFPGDFEIIVVNDSGTPLPQADWQGSKRVRVISTNRRERSAARNAGAALARGRFLHFLDDDDWFAPNALQTFWELSRDAEVGWLYGSSQLVDRKGAPLLQLRHGISGNNFIQVMAGEWIPLQASLISSDTFFEIGGFNQLISGPEDIDLLRRVALHKDLAGTADLVAFIEWGREGSSTNYDLHAAYSRMAREQILEEKGVFTRMLTSAHTDYWRGRIARVYLTSMIWNLKNFRPLTAASRAMYGIAGLASGGKYMLSSSFWRAILNSYRSETFSRGLAATASSPEKTECFVPS